MNTHHHTTNGVVLRSCQEPTPFPERLMVVSITRLMILPLTVLTVVGCGASNPSEESQPPEQVARETAITDAPAVPRNDESMRLDQLRGFQPLKAGAGEQCDELSIANDTLQLDATRSVLSPSFQQSTAIDSADLHLVVNFGSGFPSFTCIDLDSEVRRAVIDEIWPATAAGGVFTVVPADQCSVASLVLTDIVATSPDGNQVALGDTTITNQAWQWWPPFECHLDSPSSG